MTENTLKMTYEMVGGNNKDNIGANNLLVAYDSGTGQKTTIMIDRGVMFTQNYPGSGPEAVMTNCDDIYRDVKAIVLTHAHQDHIGGLANDVLRGIKLPDIYCTPLTQAYIETDLMKKAIAPARWPNFERLPIDEDIVIGDLTVKAMPVSHSIPEANLLIIGSPAGVLVHSGDLKTDASVPVGPIYNHDATISAVDKTLKDWGQQYIDLFAVDSTRAATPGFTPPESAVGETMRDIVTESHGKRVVTSMFSTHLSRIAQMADIAADQDRTIVVHGASMVWSLKTLVRAAKIYRNENQQPPWLDVPVNKVLPRLPKGTKGNKGLEDAQSLISAMIGKNVKIIEGDGPAIKKVCPENQLVICTGTQGETDSALNKAAKGTHSHLVLSPNDVVIVSGSVIPGNEFAIEEMKRQITARKVNKLITIEEAPVHTSGHGRAADIERVAKAVGANKILPIHGSQALLEAHENTLKDTFGAVNILPAIQNGHKLVITPGEPIVIEPSREPSFIGITSHKNPDRTISFTFSACDQHGQQLQKPDVPGLNRPIARRA
jgi:ribonuclease J